MNIGIIGLPQTGKKTLFELLVGAGSAAHHAEPKKTLRGVADVQDPRFGRFVDLYGPKKQTRARIDVLLPPRIEEKAISEGDIFRDLSEVEAFCHVVRLFENDAVYHSSGSIDPKRDIDFVNAEFILHDLLFIEKRLERLEKDLGKMKDERLAREREVLLQLKGPLESEKPLRTIDIPHEDEKVIRGYPLLSLRAMVIVLNIGEGDVADTTLLDELKSHYEGDGVRCLQIAAQMESEIDALETEEERAEFMEAIGIKDTALHALTEACIDALGLLSFFTVGPNEVRQWFVRRNAHAVEAAGKIHSDLARGFIRAEVIKSTDLFELGSEDKVKNAGKLAIKGRDYIVEDGDILFIRFSV
jgi:GTP-binding protein YchF